MANDATQLTTPINSGTLRMLCSMLLALSLLFLFACGSDDPGGNNTTSSDSNSGNEPSSADGVSEGLYDVWLVKLVANVDLEACYNYSQADVEGLIYNETAESRLVIKKKNPVEIIADLAEAEVNADNVFRGLMATAFNTVDKILVSSFCTADEFYVLIGQNNGVNQSLNIKSPEEIGRCSAGDPPPPSQNQIQIQSSTFSDDRDGTLYKAVKIGNQTWMAENLKYNASGSKCYGDDPSNCAIYGKLYNWATTMALENTYNSTKYGTNCESSYQTNFCEPATVPHKGICPAGWHLPSSTEQKELEDNRKSTKVTVCGSIATRAASLNDIGFSQLGGYGKNDGSFFDVNARGEWWTIQERIYTSPPQNGSTYYTLSGSLTVGANDKLFLHSVRCIKD